MSYFLKSPYFLVPAVSYILTSLTLLLFPSLIHKKRVFKEPRLNQAIQSKNKVLVVAHRGGSRIGLENTMETFKRCFEVSAPDMLEMDVCLTKNGKLVVHHDSSLQRTCNRTEHIHHFDFEDLPMFSQTVILDFGYRLSTNSTGQKIPLLETVFQAFPDMLLNIELKTPSLKAIQQLDRLIRKYKRQSKTIWGIRGSLHKQLKGINPETLTFFDQKQVLRLILLFVTGLLPFSKIEHDSLQIPVWTEDYYRWKLDVTDNKIMVHTWFKTLYFLGFLMTPIISHLKKRGILTIGWVCNDEQEYIRALNMGCCGIMTDRPDHLEGFLETKFK